MNLNTSEPDKTKLPVIFFGHGSPMNGVEKNEFSNTWQLLGESLPRPKAIICISAHWETKGIAITSMPLPKTIHDFGGFPKKLYDVEYPAPGSFPLSNEIINAISNYKIRADVNWGLDHGCWSILRRMYPLADIPVLQISLNMNKTPAYHYEFAKELKFLREKDILIIASGNIVHNLRKIDWNNGKGSDWAIKANKILKDLIIANNHTALMEYTNLGPDVQEAIPTPEHFLPLLYALALKQKGENITFFNDKLVMGSLSMTSIIVSKSTYLNAV